jgi:hypothetical protein
MKTKGLITVFLLACSILMRAQISGFHIGGRLGLGESMMSGAALQNAKPKLAVTGGIASNYQFNKWFGINADFLLSSLGVRASGSTRDKSIIGTDDYYSYNERYNLVNAEVPLTAQVNIWLSEDFFLKGYAGPAVNFNLMALQTRQYDNDNYNNEHGYMNSRWDQVNNISWSGVYGVGLGVLSKDSRIFFIDLRLNNGISPIGSINGGNIYLRYYSLGAGYVF